jgi:Meiotically Up-regulated Gene 113 (MUG113) protein
MTVMPPPAEANSARLAAREAQRARMIGDIRKIAAANGGAPPGLRQFISRTGIRRSHCIGMIWPRWSEALRYAGFAPNERQSRLDDPELLAAIAEVARIIGRIPAVTDLNTWRASGRRLSSHSTYLRHFGSMAGLLRSMKEWAGASPDRADITGMLAGVSGPPEFQQRILGAVYLLRHGQSYKIGCSKKVQRRIVRLQQALPATAKLVQLINTDDPRGIEAYWHRRFAEKRSRGE